MQAHARTIPGVAPRTAFAIGLGILWALLLGSCGETPVGEDFARYRALDGTRIVDVFAPEGPALERARTLAGRRTVIQGRPLDIRCYPTSPSGDPCGGGRAGAARVLVAKFDHPGLEPWLEGTGVEREASGFRHRGLRFGEERDALIVTRVDPERAPMPATLVLAVDPALALLDLFDLTPAWKLGHRVVLGGRTVGWGLEGQDEAGAPREPARPRTPRVISFGAQIREDGEDGDLRFLLEIEEGLESSADAMLSACRAELREGGWVAAMEGVRGRLAALLGRDPGTLPRARVWVHGSPRPMERHCGSTGPVAYEAGLLYPGDEVRGIVHVVRGSQVPATFEETYGLALAQGLVQTSGADAVAPWLVEGLAVAAAGRWWGRGLDDWCGHLVLAGLDAEAGEFLDEPSTLSPHRRAPLRGAWVGRLGRMPRSAELFEALIEGRDVTSATAELSRGFRAELRSRLLVGDFKTSWSARREARRGAVAGLDFQRGVHLRAADVWEGAPTFGSRGYGALGVDSVLANVGALGGNAVALEVTAWVEGGYPRYFGATSADTFSGGPRASALDRELLRASRLADRRGLSRLLSVDLLTNRSSSWTAWRQMPESLEEGWGATFDDLEATLVHYGLLSELCGIETLSLGTGLSNLTHVTVDEEWPADTPMAELKAARWPEMIARVRGGFSGALTYCAAGQSEVSEVSFWNDLDFTSFEARTPWVGADGWTTLGDSAMAGRWRHWIEGASEVADGAGRRVLLLGVVAPSSLGGLREPSSVGSRVDLEAQARVFQSLATALEDPETRGRLAGVFVGELSTESGRGGADDAGFFLLGKPAVEAVQGVFGQ